MNILINASNLSGGGGAQVADSIIRILPQIKSHKFVVVGSDVMHPTLCDVNDKDNIVTVPFNYPAKDFQSLITQRNHFLDELIEKYKIGCAITIFGPMKWRPKCKHISGFALAHLVLKDSPFFCKLSFGERIKWRLNIKLWEFIFRRSSDIFFTENPMITKKLDNLFNHKKKIFTITNSYNQVFDEEADQTDFILPQFDGFSMLDIASAGLHKNQEISLEIARILKDRHPGFKFRFIFTLTENQFPPIPAGLKDNILLIGKIRINECPSLYRQIDASFQPTLLECFTATYAESMRSGKPIITTDLDFAKGICQDAAVYYKATSAESAAEAIYNLATNKDLQYRLIQRGKEILSTFDTPFERVNKLISLCENIN